MKIGQRIAPLSLLQGGNKASLCWAWLLIGMIVLLPAGCSPAGGRGISVYNDGKVHSVVASVGEKIEITLQTVGPGEYGDPIVSSGSVRFLGESPAEIQNPGGARQIYRFEAVASGQAEITIQHTPGGLPQQPATPAFTLTVTVQ